jgi:hypothetical protein
MPARVHRPQGAARLRVVGIKLRRYLGSVSVRRRQRCAEFARDEAAV